MNPFFPRTALRRTILKTWSGPPVSRILLYPVIHLPRIFLGALPAESRTYQPRTPKVPQGNLACSHRWFTWPVPPASHELKEPSACLGIPPVGSYPTLSPITCAGNGGFASYRPSAGLLSAALDVTVDLHLTVPRVISPGGLFYESGLCSMSPGAYILRHGTQRRVGQPRTTH